ncbi:hypothetical protein GJ496_007569 [Pomphorhynchus laevis]|nr:hypothetical protein GJ496_007569 [Pomphorhynchus laevis]
MGKLQPSIVSLLEPEHIRVLTALELGHRNHQLVPLQIVTVISKLQRGGCNRYLEDLIRHKLVSFERSQKACGYRLTLLGYDTLTLSTLLQRNAISSVGRTIGCGKESYVYEAYDSNGQILVLKIHRLGQTCFRSLKRNRDYLAKRHAASWLYMSRLSAVKEFAHQKVLHDYGFPVPEVFTQNRNGIVMERIIGTLLNDVLNLEVSEVDWLSQQLLGIIRRFAENGLIHCDFNEFNILVNDSMTNVCVIDFPQMISTRHSNADFYFTRDVKSVCDFFRKRFQYEISDDDIPKLSDIEPMYDLDKELKASGFDDNIRKDCGLFSMDVSRNHDARDLIEDEGVSDAEVSVTTDSSTDDSDNASSSIDLSKCTINSESKRTLATHRNWTVALAQKKLIHEHRITNRQRLRRTIAKVKKDCYRDDHQSKRKRSVYADLSDWYKTNRCELE